MFGKEEEYQDDFESYSDDEFGHLHAQIKPPQPMRYVPFNSSMTGFNQTQKQIKNLISNATICLQNPPQRCEEQPSTSTATGGLNSESSNTSKYESSPQKKQQHMVVSQYHRTEIKSRTQQQQQQQQQTPPMKLSIMKQCSTDSRQKLIGEQIALKPQNSSFQNNLFVLERVHTSNKKSDDGRRNSYGQNTSQKKIYPPNSPKILHGPEISFQQYQKQQPFTFRDSLKFRQEQIKAVELEPNISARCWAVFDAHTGQFLSGKNEHVPREVASLTKIMTCWVTIQLSKKFGLKIDDTYFDVSYYGQTVGGTTANLCEGDSLSIKDLLFGLMLPSGNDAAVTLAENFGDFLDADADLSDDDISALKAYRKSKKNTKHLTDLFMSQMNLWGQRFGMTNTFYANPHGLICEKNKSTAFDVGTLCCHAVHDLVFKKIVQTKIFFSEIMDEYGDSKEIFWENTNKLLYKGYIGIKTGITTRAGPCVVEHYQDDKVNIIIVLLCCKSMDERWADAAKLVAVQRAYQF